jgi:TonB family protein
MKLRIVILLCAASCLYADISQLVHGGDALQQNLLLKHPTPEYPYEARSRGIRGSGIFLLRFDFETGHLRQVHVAKSMGNRILDQAAIAALKQWRAKPRSLHIIDVPITMWMSSVEAPTHTHVIQ